MPKPRILFVEDEDYIARVIKSSLEDAGYEVFRANSLAQGRVEAATRSPELLILDLGLPDGDGTDLIRTLRSYSSVPIIILSAYDLEEYEAEAKKAGIPLLSFVIDSPTTMRSLAQQGTDGFITNKQTIKIQW